MNEQNAKYKLGKGQAEWSIKMTTGFPNLQYALAVKQRKQAKELIQSIQAAGDLGQEQFVISPGDYLFPSEDKLHPILHGLKNMEIIANEVTFWFEPPLKRGLVFRQCENIKLSGLHIDFTIPCWFQGQVTSINRPSNELQAQVVPGYEPVDLQGISEVEGERAFMFYRKDGSFIAHRHTPTKWHLIDENGTLDCKAGRYGIPWDLQPGDYIVGSLRAGFALGTESCTQMQFEDINIWSSPGSAVWDGRSQDKAEHTVSAKPSGGHRYKHLRATRRPGTNRLHAFGSDIFHISGSDRGPILDTCELAYGSDDTFNIHGEFGRVVAPEGPTQVYLEGAYTAGDTIEFRDSTNLQLLGITKVRKVHRLTDGPQTPINESFQAQADCLVELDQALNLQPLSLVVMDGKRSNESFAIRNCWFHDNFQRALINGSPKGLIKNNIFENLGCGICIQFETWGPWMEGPFTRDLTIRGNQFIRCAPDSTVIAVSMFPASSDTHWEAMPMKNFRIEDNTIDAYSGFPIKIQNVSCLHIAENRIQLNPSNALNSGPKNTVIPDPQHDWNQGTIRNADNWLDLQNCNLVTIHSNKVG